jgi:site-specific DNA-methyltransferase (adenine-specific)
MPSNTISSLVTDPPFEIGLLGKSWDKTGIAFDVSMWQQVLRVLKPGAHAAVFGHPRTYHRTACALEDAGFEVRDQIQWIYGQGWAKGKNNLEGGLGTGLKCAAEPICLARKPLSEETLEENIAKWGTGALNIETCRVPVIDDMTKLHEGLEKLRALIAKWALTAPTKDPADRAIEALQIANDLLSEQLIDAVHSARWPSNLLLGHSAPGAGDNHGFGCTELICDDDCPVAELDRQSGYSETKRIEKPSDCGGNTWGGTIQGHRGVRGHSDSGGASRFFWCSKPSPKERTANGKVENKHVSVKPITLMRYLCKLATPAGGLVLDPFLGSGTTAIACVHEQFSCVGIDNDPESFETAKGRVEVEYP